MYIQYSKSNWDKIRSAAKRAGFPTVQAYVDFIVLKISNDEDKIKALADMNAKAAAADQAAIDKQQKEIRQQWEKAAAASAAAIPAAASDPAGDPDSDPAEDPADDDQGSSKGAGKKGK